ncbi:hypothetical protein ABIE45_002547 [Methylobacterium sp. OAE515]|uniref:hypothetical protein n=1 Tax=Methylobacterium sp. OAE515 TaxID=2817895 RepID=UPI00178B1473
MAVLAVGTSERDVVVQSTRKLEGVPEGGVDSLLEGDRRSCFGLPSTVWSYQPSSVSLDTAISAA